MRFDVSRHWHAWLLFRSKEKQDRWRILSGLSSVGMNGFFQRLNKLRCVTAFWWFACCGSFCVGFTVRFLCCGWLCVWGCFTWNISPTYFYGWLWWWLVGRLGGVLWWFFSVWISFICSPTERTGILGVTISFMATYQCFTWNVCGDVRGAEEWGDGFGSRHFSPTGCCGGWSF